MVTVSEQATAIEAIRIALTGLTLYEIVTCLAEVMSNAHDNLSDNEMNKSLVLFETMTLVARHYIADDEEK